MEDTKSLLMMVLHKVFQNQPNTIENTFQLIHNFNNGKIEKKNYEKTLKTICDLMNDKLPSPILVYILTLVDVPQGFDSQSPIIEKMKRTHDFLPEVNVRPHLLEYLNHIKPATNIKHSSQRTEMLDKNRNTQTTSENSTNECQQSFVKPTKVIKRRKKFVTADSPQRLLDICAVYVVKNEISLKAFYRNKQALAWRLINEDVLSGNQLMHCYELIKDVNKKIKWLREIESENISSEMLMEEYKNSEIFLKENHFETKKDPFQLTEECERIIHTLFETE